MSAQHTPGPWHVDLGHVSREHLKGRIQIAVWDEDDACIAACMDSDENARLIAASPDLLEALRDILRIVKSVQLSHGVPGHRERIERAEAAIAKATGAQP